MRRAPAVLFVLLFAGCRHSQLPDLPLVELPPAHAHVPMAVIVSGDGGWRAIDREIADGLHDRGFGVVGLVAPDFFSSRKTPAESAYALRRIINHYGSEWRSSSVIAVGYSRGAGVLPFMINRLPPNLRDSIKVVALIGLDRTIDFEVSPFDLLRTEPTAAEIPVTDEVNHLHARVLCIYGVTDRNNLCRELQHVVRVAEPGGHHMTTSYDDLARVIWTARPRPGR